MLGIRASVSPIAVTLLLLNLPVWQAEGQEFSNETDYGCIVEEAHYSQFDGETGRWSNAPKSLKIRIEDCRPSNDPFCQEGWGRSITVTPSIGLPPKKWSGI